MSGHRKWSEIKERERQDPAFRAAVERERRAVAVAMRLGDMRRQLGLTQEEVAAVMGVSQPNVSKIENGDDPHLGTMRAMVEAMGGTLHVIAEFPEEGVSFDLLPHVTAKPNEHPPRDAG